MPLIHQVELHEQYQHEIDPVRGLVARKVQTIGKGATSRIRCDGETYDIQSDGSFDVPDEVVEHYTRQPGWYTGANPFPVEEAPKPKSRAKAAA